MTKTTEEKTKYQIIKKMGMHDIVAVFEFVAEGSWDIKQAQDDLHRMQIQNIDICLAEQRKSDLDEIFKLITKEIAICHKEGMPTSRLTSLYNKITDFVTLKNKSK